MSNEASLRILDRADKEIVKLTRADIGAVYEFMHKFRRNPANPGLHLQQLGGDSRLWSARVNKDYRALLLHVSDQDYLLVDVKPRGEVYENLDRYAYQVNRVTGGIEVIDLQPVGDSLAGRALADDAPAVPPAAVVKPEPLFASLRDEQLIELGVAEPLLPHIRAVTTEDELLELVKSAPTLTVDVLFALHDGMPVEEVFTKITQPVQAEEPVDPEDFATAADRQATQVSSDDEALQAMLGEPFERWQVFLHPYQRKIVEAAYNGPVRVSGGPGTGKTIVALHRVAHLVAQLPPGADRPVLLTTFNRNLAADLRTKLVALGGQEVAARVDIVNIDRLATRVVREAQGGPTGNVMDDNEVPNLWGAFLAQIGGSAFDADFLAAEWTHVILGNVLTTRTEYFRARRAGRGQRIGREQRDEIWRLAERFTSWLDQQGIRTWRQIAAQAARVEMDRAARADSDTEASSGSRPRHRYRHIVVDEAQDLSAAHWKMLRAMVPPGRDDMFLTGDTHQRLYDNYATLSSLGINIRGRSRRLTLSYRTTRQILATALGIMTGETYDDLDGGSDTLAGYRSVLHSNRAPIIRGAATWAEEMDLVASQLAAWGKPDDGSVAIALPTRDLLGQLMNRLRESGTKVSEIGPDGPRSPDGVHLGTMHRFKGLEYQRVVIAGASDGLLPRLRINEHREADPRRYERERQRDRSLLFVAATRARDDLAIFWHGKPSPFLPRQTHQVGPA